MSADLLARVPAAYRHLVPEHGKSPWSPSKTATARVPNPMPVPTVHEACGGPVVIAHHTEVYGREFHEWPWMYRCHRCDASVGMHPFTSIPLGTLADKALRTTRTACKQPFELLWKGGRVSRTEAYEGLAAHLGIELDACHFGLFNAEQCHAAKAWAVAELRRRAGQPSTVQRSCKACHKTFTARSADVKRGWAQFCSKRCKAVEQEHRTGQFAALLRRADFDDEAAAGHPMAGGYHGHGQL